MIIVIDFITAIVKRAHLLAAGLTCGRQAPCHNGTRLLLPPHLPHRSSLLAWCHPAYTFTHTTTLVDEHQSCYLN